MQATPPSVPRPIGAQQGGEADTPRGIRRRWAWAEASVWTERMLTALEAGVKGGVWFRLIDKVYAERNLLAAWAKVRANDGAAGVDRVTVAMFEKDLEANLRGLSQELTDGSYRPKPVRRHYIPKPGGGERPLGIPTVRDRVVQTALRHVLEPIFEHGFADGSYGFRPGRGCKDALREVDRLLKEGHRYVVDADLKSYFDTIPHQRLMERVREKVADGPVLKLVESFLTQGVMEGLSEWTPTAGSPQGAVVSPLLSNIYLDPLDRLMERRGYRMVRYADDFVILCTSRGEAQAALATVRDWAAQAGLGLHPDKTRVVDAAVDEGGFEFLGYRFERGRRWPRDKSLEKLKDAVRRKTRRTDGRSLYAIVADLNGVLRGWFGYFRHSYKAIFPQLDGYVRGRLRSILRKRHKGKGRGRGRDQQRWPNALFAAVGLFSLSEAQASTRQPARAVNC